MHLIKTLWHDDKNEADVVTQPSEKLGVKEPKKMT